LLEELWWWELVEVDQKHCDAHNKT
jgi:hypothetical protein